MTGRFRPAPPSSPTRPGERPSPTALVDILGARVHVDIVIPRTTFAGKMRLVSRSEEFEADLAAREWMSSNGFPVDGSAHSSPYVALTWQYERLARILAVAIREPANTERALAAPEDYRGLDDDQLDALGLRYADLRAQLSPIEAGALSDDDLAAIVAAAKKKDTEGLMLFGSSKLARFISTSADQPATSPTTTS